MEGLIEVREVYKTFQNGIVRTEVLRGVHLTIKRGDFVSIMGPSGSGKSTLLYLIGGLEKPDSGSILVNHKNISDMNDKEESFMRRQNIGFIFQFYNLIPNLNVEENVLLPVLLDGRKVKDYKGKVNELLEIVGLSDHKRHTPRELSGGQQQRVAVARALIHDPDIILADEPTGNLDSKSGDEIMELFYRINKEKGKTIVQVTHSDHAAGYGNQIIHINDGCIGECKLVRDVLHDPSLINS